MTLCKADRQYSWEIREKYMNREGRHIAIGEVGLLDKIESVVLPGPVLQEIFEEALKRGVVTMPLTPQQRLNKLQERCGFPWLHRLVFCAGAMPEITIPAVHIKLRGRALMKDLAELSEAVCRELGGILEVKVTFNDDDDK